MTTELSLEQVNRALAEAMGWTRHLSEDTMTPCYVDDCYDTGDDTHMLPDFTRDLNALKTTVEELLHKAEMTLRIVVHQSSTSAFWLHSWESGPQVGRKAECPTEAEARARAALAALTAMKAARA